MPVRSWSPTPSSPAKPSGALAEIVSFLRLVADDDTIAIDPKVARSEAETGFRNAALANFMRAYGNLTTRPSRRWASTTTTAPSR